MVIAVDFDKTLFNSHYPDVGEPNWDVINWCKQKQKEGHILILWTCRRRKNLKKAVKACESVGLKFDYINTHTKESLAMFGRSPPGSKIYADIYIDDRAYRPDEINEIENIFQKCNTLAEK